MPGASTETRRVTVLNANWNPATKGRDGRFELMVVTDDDEIHTIAASAAEVSAVVALSQADTVLAWDPTNRTLIAANIVGTMPWTTREQTSQE
jgi:hypothetical protein